jgi:hypothetical protein
MKMIEASEFNRRERMQIMPELKDYTQARYAVINIAAFSTLEQLCLEHSIVAILQEATAQSHFWFITSPEHNLLR